MRMAYEIDEQNTNYLASVHLMRERWDGKKRWVKTLSAGKEWTSNTWASLFGRMACSTWEIWIQTRATDITFKVLLCDFVFCSDQVDVCV